MSTENVKPWYFIPSLYFAQGLPYILINSVSVIMYKKMGIENGQIALWTSLLYLPWVIKMLWSPLIELYLTTKKWIIFTQLIMAVCLSLAAISLFFPNFFFVSLIIFMGSAFISATQDTAIDGFYLEVLNKENQDIFAGIRPIFYRVALIFGSGFLVFWAGILETNLKNTPLSWALPLGLAALIFLSLSVYHWLLLPRPKKEDKVAIILTHEKNQLLEIFASYFRKPHLSAIIAFILMYRFGEALLLKLNNPFLLDKISAGGLELSTQEVGLVYGTFGLLSLIIGGILGGLIIAKYGLKKSLLPMALTLNIPHIFYLYMAVVQPHSTLLVCLLVSLEQFGYGLGLTAFMIYLMRVSSGKYKTSYYAISTGIMALGMMVPGIVSGYLEQAVGYSTFFWIVCLFAIPSLLTVFLVPKTPIDFLKVILERERVKHKYDYQKITASKKAEEHDLCVKHKDGSQVLLVDVVEKGLSKIKKINQYQQAGLLEYWLIDLNELSVSIYSLEPEEQYYKITNFLKKDDASQENIQPLDAKIKSKIFPDLEDLTADELLIV